MTYHHEGETGSYKLAGNNAELELTMGAVISEVCKRNWPLISLYGAITLLGLFASYSTNGWVSVAFSGVVVLATFLIWLLMLWKVITITRTKTIR